MQFNEVSKTKFKSKALEFFRQVEATRKTVVITDHGKPALEVRPYRDAKRNPLELLRGSVVRFENTTDPVLEDWDAQQ